MMDKLLQLAVSGGAHPNGTVDISETPPFYTTAVAVGDVGLPRDSWFAVHVTAGSAEAIEPLTFTLQVTVDGTNYYDISTVTFPTLAATSNIILAAPVGPVDLRVDKPYTAANIKVRLKIICTEVEVADDPTFEAFLTGPQEWRPMDVA